MKILSRSSAWMICAVFCFCGCAPDRAQWMAQAENQEAKTATGSIGDEKQVRVHTRQAAGMLTGLTAAVLKKPPPGNQQVVSGFVNDSEQISSGLQAIAESQTDDQFVAAVFGMCEPDRIQAAPRVGHVMIGIAGGIQGKPPANVPTEQVEQMVSYFQTIGNRLINIPTQCDHARAAMAQAADQEQQSEAQHQANVNAAVGAAELLLVGAVVVGAAAASRPVITPVQNNYYHGY